MSRLAKFLIACSLLALPAYAGNTRKTDEKKKVKQRVVTTYDPKKDVTAVGLPTIIISEKPDAGGTGLPLPSLNEGLRLTVFFTHPGKIFAPQEFVTLSFLSVTKGKALYAEGEELLVKTKDARTSLGKLTLKNTNVSIEFPGRKIQALYQDLSLQLSRDDFNRLLSEKSLTLLLGKTSVKLGKEEMAGLRELAGRLVAAQ